MCSRLRCGRAQACALPQPEERKRRSEEKREERVGLPNKSDEILLLHNPKCSKSRQTRALLEERGLDFETRLYLEEPLSADELADLARRLGKRPIDFTRTGQAEFEAAGLHEGSSDGEILDAMVAAPILMERPVVIRGARAAIGRPPEAVRALFD